MLCVIYKYINLYVYTLYDIAPVGGSRVSLCPIPSGLLQVFNLAELGALGCDY